MSGGGYGMNFALIFVLFILLIICWGILRSSWVLIKLGIPS
ncbi:YjcZ family sporulation protein [Fredinandcohnia onubensis]|nr:YjcZ family sporulation protein [Fredinandcohnia onubensis]